MNCEYQNYIESLLKEHNIEHYKFIVDEYAGTALKISHKLKSYKLCNVEDDSELILLEMNMASNPKKKEKYHQVKGMDNKCLNDILKWISKRF